MKQDGSALTRLESTMLGMWLMGCKKVYVYNMEEMCGIGNRAPSEKVKATMQFSHGMAPSLIGEACGYSKTVEIKPWLESHGITPPEVVG